MSLIAELNKEIAGYLTATDPLSKVMLEDAKADLGKVVVFLESVGTAVDPKTGETFTMCVDGTIEVDPDGANILLEDCCEEWYESLSWDDSTKVAEVLGALPAPGEVT